MLNVETNKLAAFAFVEFGLLEKMQGRRESASGPGSSLGNTVEIRSLIVETVKKYNIKTLLDLGCGDWHWMRDVFENAGLKSLNYEGWDIHPGLIEELQGKYGSEYIQFRLADIIQTPMPRVDLIVCRDVLFHLENELVSRILHNIKASGSKYLISTTFPDEEENVAIKQYIPIDGWGFRRINLDIAPFNLKNQLIKKMIEPLNSHKGMDRFVALYKMY